LFAAGFDDCEHLSVLVFVSGARTGPDRLLSVCLLCVFKGLRCTRKSARTERSALGMLMAMPGQTVKKTPTAPMAGDGLSVPRFVDRWTSGLPQRGQLDLEMS
jgi:hypothetical protein